MYTNKHAWTNKDGTYKEIYYYVCSRNRMVRGKHCEYKAMLKKTDIEPMVIEAIREIVRNEEYAQAIKKRIGVQIDTKAVDKELEGYQAKLKEVDLNKTRLEREIDSLPADAKYRERKLHDMTLRLDSLYDVIVELEEKIEDARLRRDAIKQQAITLENIYKIMVNFDCVYNIINDEEKRNVVTALIKEIEIYRNDESEYPLKRIGLNFPVFKDGGEVTELLWDKGNTVETCAVRQLAILSSAAQCVREGGILVYSACTFSTEENEGVVQKFLESHPEFVLEKPNVTFGRPAYGVDAVRIFPMDGGEGHFAARFRRVAPCEERFAPFSFKPDRETQAHAEELYTSLFTDVPGRFQRVRDRVILLPNELPDIAGLSVLRAGVEVRRGKKEPHRARAWHFHGKPCGKLPQRAASHIERSCFIRVFARRRNPRRGAFRLHRRRRRRYCNGLWQGIERCFEESLPKGAAHTPVKVHSFIQKEQKASQSQMVICEAFFAI